MLFVDIFLLLDCLLIIFTLSTSYAPLPHQSPLSLSLLRILLFILIFYYFFFSYPSKMSTAGIMASPTIVTTRHYCSTEGSSTSSDTRNSRLHGIRCYVCRRILKVPQERDKRLASSYPSFIVGRLLGLGGSVGLLIGLFLRYFFLDNDGSWKGVSYFIIIVSIITFAIGAVLVIWATLYKSAKARRDLLEEKKGIPGPSSPPFSPLRPSSTLSSSSFQSHSSATAILPPQGVKNHPVGSINC